MLVDRLVIERTYRNNEFGDPVVDFESKDYAECVIEELEKIKAEILKWQDDLNIESNNDDFYVHHGLSLSREIIDNHISELKGE